MSGESLERSVSDDKEQVDKILNAYDKVSKNALELILRASRGEDVEWQGLDIDELLT